jgi:transposase-like protein
MPSYDLVFIQESLLMIKVKRFKDEHNVFKWKHFEGDIILWLVRWYGRYALSYNDLREIAAERGLSVCRLTIYRCWVQQYSPELERRVKLVLKKTCDSWKLDETYIKVKGCTCIEPLICMGKRWIGC